RVEAEGRDTSDEKALRLAAGRERKLWLSQKLIDAGMERARAWGWPNTYTYTKAMGEQAIAMSGCSYSLVRPAIVESALRFTFPDEWLEPFPVTAEAYRKTSAPLFRKLAQAGRALIADKGASWGAPITSALLKRADQALESVDRKLATIEGMWDLYLPFVAGE